MICLFVSLLLCLPGLVFRKLHFFFSPHFSPRDTFSTDTVEQLDPFPVVSVNYQTGPICALQASSEIRGLRVGWGASPIETSTVNSRFLFS